MKGCFASVINNLQDIFQHFRIDYISETTLTFTILKLGTFQITRLGEFKTVYLDCNVPPKETLVFIEQLLKNWKLDK